MKGYNINVITSENLFDYITLPDYITEKFSKGIISAAHYSDIIRLELLIRYGGVWIDSTVLCTGNEMCPVIEKAPLFVYLILMKSENNSIASNCLISARPHSPVLILTRDLFLEYWKRHNMLEHYFIFHLFFSMAMTKFPGIWGRIPPYNNVSPQLLVRAMNTAYSDDHYATFKGFSSFHKLNYRLTCTSEGTFYDVLIRRYQF